MTTIAVRDGFIAADSRETIEGEGGDYCRLADKLYEVLRAGCGPFIVGLAGDSGPGLLFLEWLKTDSDEIREQLRALDTDFTAVVCAPDGRVWEYDHFCIGTLITAPVYAIGSGAEAALGALKAGASAIRAVEIASEIDPYTGGPVVHKQFHAHGRT